MIAYKLTHQDMTTYHGCKWVVGKWKTASGEGNLCGPGWLHCYEHPLLAVLHNPIHGNFQNPRLWECEACGIRLRDGQLKQGFTRLRLVRELPLPQVTTEQRVRYAILCAKRVCRNTSWNLWADCWLSGEDRSITAAWAARAAARAAAREALEAARAAESAALEAAARAAEALEAARAAEAAESAEAAARAAGKSIDLIAIAEEVVR